MCIELPELNLTTAQLKCRTETRYSDVKGGSEIDFATAAVASFRARIFDYIRRLISNQDIRSKIKLSPDRRCWPAI